MKILYLPAVPIGVIDAKNWEFFRLDRKIQPYKAKENYIFLPKNLLLYLVSFLSTPPYTYGHGPKTKNLCQIRNH